jgi:hypothetical protein
MRRWARKGSSQFSVAGSQLPVFSLLVEERRFSAAIFSPTPSGFSPSFPTYNQDTSGLSTVFFNNRSSQSRSRGVPSAARNAL